MTDDRPQEPPAPRAVPGWGVVLAAVVVAAMLASMMLWALEFMNREFDAPPEATKTESPAAPPHS